MSNIRYNGFKPQITKTADVKTIGKASVENAGSAGSAGGVTGSSAPKSINTKVYTPNAPTQDNGGVMLTSNANSGGSTVTTGAPVQTPTCSSDVVTPTTPAVGDMDVTGSNQVTGSNNAVGSSGWPDNYEDLPDEILYSLEALGQTCQSLDKLAAEYRSLKSMKNLIYSQQGKIQNMLDKNKNNPAETARLMRKMQELNEELNNIEKKMNEVNKKRDEMDDRLREQGANIKQMGIPYDKINTYLSQMGYGGNWDFS